MAAAIIKLDSLADPVRTTAENGNFLAIRRLRFIGHLAVKGRGVGRIHIGCWRSKFGRAGIDPLIDRKNAHLTPRFRDISFVPTGQHGHAGIREAHAFEATKRLGRFWNAEFLDLGFCVDQILDLLQEPRIDFAGFMDFIDGKTEAKGLADLQNAIRRWRAKRRFHGIAIIAEA